MRSALTRLCLCVMLLLALASSNAHAEQRECFAVSMTNSTSGGSVGSILLDKCTGNSWVLTRTTVANGGTAMRWFPITVEKGESVMPRSGLQ